MKNNSVRNADEWDLVIKPKVGLLEFNIRELFHYRDLIGLLVKRDLANVYKQTVLGWLWFVIQPLMTTLMFMFVFGKVAKISTDGIPQPLFYFSGTILWTFFSTNLIKCSDTFATNSGLFGKIYFPRFTVPLSYIATTAFSFLIQFVTLGVIYAAYVVQGLAFHPTLWLLLTPVLVVQLGLLSAGVGLTISALTTKYRDLKQLVAFGMQLWMYATPIVYPLSQVPAEWRWAYLINPVSQVVETFRYSLFGQGNFNLLSLGASMVATVVLIMTGLIVFNHNERTFIDVI